MIIVSMFAGILCGQLINYLADVLPGARQITEPACGTCLQPYGLMDYLLIRPCPGCGQHRGRRTGVVLIITTVLSLLLYHFPFSVYSYWASLPILVFFGVIMVIDIEHRLVLFETSLFGLGMFLLYGWLGRGLRSTAAGGLAGFLIMIVLYLLGVGFTKLVGWIKHKKLSEVAFGFGDVFAGTFLGLLAGWPAIAGATIIAMLAFGGFSFVYLLFLLLTKRYQAFGNALPFVPFLVLGTIMIFYL